jgi:hypothetical protein
VTDANNQNNKTINQSPDRFMATVPLLKTFTEAELRKLESLIVAELNARSLSTNPPTWLKRMLSK